MSHLKVRETEHETQAVIYYFLDYLTALLRSGHTERGLPQRTAVSVRCEMLHSKQTLLTIIF